jgi:ABC-2 type transport system ATP-binding protein
MSIEVKNISKTFTSYAIFKRAENHVLNNINFKIRQGDILGLIGKNGSGKTTLLKIILNLIEQSSGDVIISNRSKKYLAYVNSNSRSFFWRISARDNLLFYGKLLDLSIQEIDSSIDKLSNEFNVSNILDIPFMKLSSGQMQIFNVIRALLRQPDYIFLDEPTTSLDLESSNNLLRILKKYLLNRKIPTIWCSHNLDEIDSVCTKFAVIDNKRFSLLQKDQFIKIKNQSSHYCFEIKKDDLININKDFEIISKFEDSVLISINNEQSPINELINFFHKKNIELISIENKKNMKGFKFDQFFK